MSGILIVVGLFAALILFKFGQAFFRSIGWYNPQDKTTPKQAAHIIDDFLNDADKGAGAFDWFCGTDYYTDPRVQQAAAECAEMMDKYAARGAYCSEEGFARMRELRDWLHGLNEQDSGS
jgi:hypothetical protein